MSVKSFVLCCYIFVAFAILVDMTKDKTPFIKRRWWSFNSIRNPELGRWENVVYRTKFIYFFYFQGNSNSLSRVMMMVTTLTQNKKIILLTRIWKAIKPKSQFFSYFFYYLFIINESKAARIKHMFLPFKINFIERWQM